MIALHIIACGPATSIQDAGRYGFARIGLPSAGAMDLRALHTANALAGNRGDEAAIELAYMGLVARVEGGSVRMALAGAEAAITCDDRPERAHRSFLVHDGQTLRIGAMRNGAYAILAIAGGMAIAPALGSRALDARAAIGGWHGRALRAGDRLPLTAPAPCGPDLWSDPVSLDPQAPIRVVLGPQDDAFTERGLQTLIGRPFQLSHGVSRMAYRLDGPPIERRPGIEMISDGTLPGSIQVPPDGLPIVLMADRQTVGGYPKIATVIGTDLGKLAQRRPGDQIDFVAVGAAEAREIARQARLTPPQVHAVPEGLTGADLAASHTIAMLDPERIARVADAVVHAGDVSTWEAPAKSQQITRRSPG